MKAFRLGLVIIAATMIIFGLGGTAMAFHDGGVATCDGCHSMHNSEGGVPNVGPIRQGGAALGTVGTGISTFLTKGTDPSSTCLNCHTGTPGSYHISTTTGGSFTPGGDFYWLTKTFTWSAHGSTHSSEGDDHGHNIVALDYGFTADATLTQAPGGTYLASNLGCNSCHDPHAVKNGGTRNGQAPIEGSGSYGADPATGNFGAYRILGDVGYDGGQGVGANFTNAAPIATTVSGLQETDANHTDYGMGMSEWCANCHTGFTADSSNPMRHPANNDAHLGSTYSNNYNAYVKTGDFTGGAGATAYLALVPFERGLSDPTALDPTSTQGPNTTSNVMCLTCHRAHASAFENMTRWDMTTEFPVTDSHPNGTDGSTALDVTNSYYGRDMTGQFGEFQRSFCNKCHVQD